MKITQCKVNHLINPLGYHMTMPVFSWCVCETDAKTQSAARIRVFREDEIVVDTEWANLDSIATKIPQDLKPRTRYTWTVAVRADNGEEAVSAENWFETAKMDEPWRAQWIGCDEAEMRHPVFSKNINPAKAVKSARLYICGLGLYEAFYNEQKIGKEFLTPYCNNYNGWLQYQTYDLTEQFADTAEQGELSVTLGNGWYKGRFGFDRSQKPYYGEEWKLIAELHLVYEDGSEDVIGTDESWQVTRSNITFSNIYDGEQRDDSLAQTTPVSAKKVEAPAAVLVARWSTPVTVQEELEVKEVIRTPAGETVVDIGQNMAGGFRLKVHEPAGIRVHIQFGEILQDGNFYRDNLRTAKAEYVYISDGKPHTLEPKFTYYGYRYAKIEGVSNLKASDFTALAYYSSLPKAGYLTTGNTLVNQLISNVEWGQKGNFIDVPTDCPQRDERMGWTGDAQVFSGTACYQRDSYAFFAKYLHDIETEQKENDGAVPDVAPCFGKKACAAAWGDAACIIPWNLYQFYGDKSILEQQYESMCAWVDYMTGVDGDDNGWRRKHHYGDWLALDAIRPENLRGGTDVGMVASTQFRHSVLLLAETARVLGKEEDAKRYDTLAEQLLEEIRREYFTPTGRCAVNTQTGLLLALQDETAPDKARSAEDLAAILRENEGKLQTGFVGTPLLCPTLTANGHEDLAFDLLLNEDYPGWLYAVKMGATTVWERWNSVGADGKIAENGMNSLNHYAYGSIVEWLYSDVAGLSPAKPGFRVAKLTPHLHTDLGKVELRYLSVAGEWQTGWEILENGDVSYHCTVPFGCTAELLLPYGGGEYSLTAGIFTHTYTPNCVLKAVYTTNMPMQELLQNAKVKAALTKIMPQITQLPPSMLGMSMRALASKMGGVKPEMLDRIDGMLAKL